VPAIEPAEIRHAAGPGDMAHARALFIEYAKWLNVDLCFQGFDAELAGLPGAYAPPYGRLLLTGPLEAPFGCIALRPLAAKGDAAPDDTSRGAPVCGEVKRLYVQPAHRHGGHGVALAERLVSEARAIGYRELKLDTFDWMTAARALYARLGFRESTAYYDNPYPGVVYMSCTL